jgi:enediyne biosynthesis thioesterase
MAGIQTARLGPSSGRESYAYRHVVSFEETNVVGNVYYVRHVAWQGRCREMFLKDRAPAILDEIAHGLRLVTLRVGCEYLEELRAFDEVEIRMSLAQVRGHRIGLDFDYALIRDGTETLAAQGFQEIGCMRAAGAGYAATPVPAALGRALAPYAAASG